jgi:sec-independent protein translocase protein TatA
MVQQQDYLSKSYIQIREVKPMLEGWEWLIIGVVAIIIIMWGPAKIPELAKALGRAKGEFSKASKDFNDAAITTANTPTVSAKSTYQAQTQPERTKDEMLIETAHNLGIQTNGKTKQQIAQEIEEKLKLLGTS